MNLKTILTVAVLLVLALTLVPASATSQANVVSDTQEYDLLIIAPDDFIDELQPLKRFKDASFTPTMLLSLSQVDQNPNCNTSGWDQPERIKRCIAYYQQTSNVRYVMLVGDSDQFPVRYTSLDTSQPRGYQPADLFYADLYKSDGSFADWDGNGNGAYAETDITSSINNLDDVDWHPDVAVGRVPASDDVEVTRYVDKIISYELSATNSGWFKTALLVTGLNGDTNDETLKNDIATNYLSGFTSHTWYDEDVWPDHPCTDWQGTCMDDRAQGMTDYINEGAGFLNYAGHGETKSDQSPPRNSFVWVYYDRHLNDLTNTDRLPVVFANACETGEFAPSAPYRSYADISGVFHQGHVPQPGEIVPPPDPVQPPNGDLEAFAEQWLVYRDTGAIGYIGSAGTGNTLYDDPLDKDFFAAYAAGHDILGDAWTDARERFLNGRIDGDGNLIGSDEWHRAKLWANLMRYHLFGDPSLRVGGAFTYTQSGDVWDASAPDGPWTPNWGYRITQSAGDVTVPAGRRLTIYSGASVLFEHGTKITAVDSDPANGLRVGEPGEVPVWFISLPPDPESDYAVQGVKVTGELRLRNGGQIKLY
jgi:hypothetical protein